MQAFSFIAMASIAAVLGLCSPVNANQSSEVDYTAWTMFLRQTVLEVGRSDRRPPLRPIAKTGSRIYRGNMKRTRNESNRLFYHSISAVGMEYLVALRQSMEALTELKDFETMSENEALAFWLNLHNIAVVELVAKNYPLKESQKLVEAHLDEPTLRVFGQAWSIRQLENHVVETWRNPLVVYGFHRGHIGSPNIRREAFTGDTVWDALKDNAGEFVTSLRGVQFWGSSVRVSSFYKNFEGEFSDLGGGLKTHLLKYAAPKMISDIRSGRRVKAVIEDGTVNDLYSGVTSGSSAVNDNPSALVFSQRLSRTESPRILDFFTTATSKSTNGINLPGHARNLVEAVFKRKERQRQEGLVGVEELGNDPEDSSSQNQSDGSPEKDI